MYRGTPMYMAPEILLNEHSRQSEDILVAGIKDLMCMDIWSLAMCLYVVLNPNHNRPYVPELLPCTSHTVIGIEKYLVGLYRKGVLPAHHIKYQEKRDGCWSHIVTIYNSAASIDAANRPTAAALQSKFKRETAACIPSGPKEATDQDSMSTNDNDGQRNDDQIDDNTSATFHAVQNKGHAWPHITFSPLRCSQSTVLENFDFQVSLDVDAGCHSSEIISLPQNDATNACTFLDILIWDSYCSQMKHIHDPDLKNLIKISEDIMLNFPSAINQQRDSSRAYDGSEAVRILNNISKNKYSCTTELSTTSVTELGKSWENIKSAEIEPYLLIAPPYTVLVLCSVKSLIVVDTHPVIETYGGKNTALI